MLIAIGIALAVAGCSGTKDHPAASPSPSAMTDEQLLTIGRQHAQCLRDHGLSDVTEPNVWHGTLKFGGPQYEPDRTTADVAYTACKSIQDKVPARYLYQNWKPTAADVDAMGRFANCLRQHGFPDWPNPDGDGEFPIRGTNFETAVKPTSNVPVVTTQISADRRHLVHVGDHVSISMSGVQPFAGTVVRVGRAATTPSSQGGSDAGSSGGSAQSLVQVTIKATVPAGAADLEAAPVQVAITRETHQNVLLVPVTALLARPGGGYQVRLESDQYVTVEPGLFDSVSGTVEVTGALTAGQRVKVPVS